MKKLFSILAIFAFILMGGFLLVSCGDSEYPLHIPQNLEEYGIKNISTSSGHITKDDKVIHFIFMPRYSYDADTLTVQFQNNDGEDVAVSDFIFDSYDDSQREKTYHVTLQKPQEVTIKLEGKAKIDTQTFQVEQIDGDTQLTDVNKANLMLNFEINGQSTGDLTYEQFNEMLTSEEDVFLKSSQELDYGSQIKITIWNKNALSLFREGIFFIGDDTHTRGDLENWEFRIETDNGKKILKNTVTFTLEENIKVDFNLQDTLFEEVKFDQESQDFLRQGFLYFTTEDYFGTPFEIYSGENKIETLADLLKEQTVDLKLEGVEQSEIGYIAQCVKSNKFNHFSISVNGNYLSNPTVETQETQEYENTIYHLIIRNVAVNNLEQGKFFTNSSLNRRIELFKIIWSDFQNAMNAEFAKLPITCEFDDATIEYMQTVNEISGLTFAVNGSSIYILKSQNIEYYFDFNESALGRTFRVSVGDDSEEITLTDTNESQTFTFNGGKITLTYNPKAENWQGENTQRVSATGRAEDFASALKIEFVEK